LIGLHGAGNPSATNIRVNQRVEFLNNVKHPHERNRILRSQIFAAFGSLDAIVGRSGVLTVSRSTALSAIRPIPRRGLSRVEAAMYIGISASTFDKLVADGRMPRPRRIDTRKLWDVHELDIAFNALPSDDGLGGEIADGTWSDIDGA